MMVYILDIIDLLREVCYLLATHPAETGVLAGMAFLVSLLWKALRFVLGSAADAVLSYLLTERVLKRASPPDERLESREDELSRELGRREAAEEALREQLERECRRADRLEAELRESCKPWWRRLLG